MRETFALVSEELAERIPELVVIVGDISHGLFKNFAARFPDRYYNIGILEPAMIGIAAGMARAGLQPVVHTIAPFLVERSFEQLKLDFGYQGLSVSLVSVGGSFDYSQLGVSHHTYSDVSLISQIDGSSVHMPGSPNEFETLYRENFSRPGIKYFRLSESRHSLHINEEHLTEGSGVLLKEGSDLTLVTSGPLVNVCDAALESVKEAITADLIYLPTVKPLDTNIIQRSISRTGRLITVDNLHDYGGLMSLVLPALKKVQRPLQVKQFGVRSFIHEYGNVEDLYEVAGLTSENVAGGILDFVKNGS